MTVYANKPVSLLNVKCQQKKPRSEVKASQCLWLGNTT